MERMPVLFIGHGSPMNAIEENEFSKKMGGAWKNACKAGSGALHFGALVYAWYARK